MLVVLEVLYGQFLSEGDMRSKMTYKTRLDTIQCSNKKHLQSVPF